MQGKPAVGAERTVSASRGQGNQGRVNAPLDMDWTDLVQFVQSPKEASVTHSYYFSLPKNRPKGAPDGLVTQSSLKTDDAFMLFGVCKDGKRNDANLLSRSAITLDYDQPDALGLMRRLRLESLSIPFAYVWHTTRSHDINLVAERVQPKVRIIVPLSRDVSPTEYHLLVKLVAKMFPATLDPASLKPSQMMYCPIHNKGAPYRCGAFRGRGYLEPDSVLAFAPADEAEAEQENERKRKLAVQDDGDIDPLVNAQQPLRGITLEQIEHDLDRLDPDMGYEDWMTVIRAVHHQTVGSDEGFELIDTWSSGGSSYKPQEVLDKWDELTHSPKSGKKPQSYATIVKWMNEQRADEARKVRDELIDEIENCNDEQQLETKLIERIARTAELTPLGRKKLGEVLIKRQKIVLGVALTAAEMRKAIAPVARQTQAVATVSASQGDTRYTEMGNTQLLYDRIGRNLIFIPELQVWYRWNKGHWQEYPVEAIKRVAQQVIDDMPRHIPDTLNNAQIGEYLAWCIKSQTKHMVDAMVALLPGTPDSDMLVPGAMLDSDPWLLGVRNGVLDLKTGELRDAERADLVTRVTACDYDPDAPCPLFEKVVADAFFDDAQLIDWFQRVIGYSLCGNPKEQFFVIPYGLGSNGKSTILNAIRDVLGMHAASTPYTTFLTDGKSQVSATGPNEALLRLKGSRFVYMSEPESGMQLRASLIKSVTGGDELTARGVHAKKSIAFKPTWVIFMPTNHKPIVRDDDHGIWRRIRLVPFERNFDEDKLIEKDTELDEKLKAEHEGILAWCVAGATRYLRDGLGDQPRAVSEAHDAYKTDMDVLHEWLEDHWIIEPLAKVSAAELFSSWEKYALRTQTPVKLSQKALGRKMLERGFRQYKTRNGRGWVGLTRRERSAEDEGFDGASS
jgi:P4 family phage/plasmid primase-like protien